MCVWCICILWCHFLGSEHLKIERSFNPSPLFLQMRKLKQKVWFVQRTIGDRSSFPPSVRFPFSTTYSSIHCLSQNWVNNTTESLCVLFFILRSKTPNTIIAKWYVSFWSGFKFFVLGMTLFCNLL